MSITFPPFPRHLSAEERRALLFQKARDMAEATIRDGGIDRARVDLDRLTAEAATGITLAWLSERVAALESAGAESGKAKARRSKGST